MDLIKKIKQKKELRGLSDIFVKNVLSNHLSKNSLHPPFTEKQQKQIIKETRKQLRNYTGRFQKKPSKEKISHLIQQGKTNEILKTHSSTKERLPYYKELKKLISNFSPDSILDLGCGLNPLALADKKTKYYAADINEENLFLVNEFFKKNKIKGKTFFHDLTKINFSLPKAELCLLLKVFDVIERKSHKLAEKIIREVPCKTIIVSFSTKTLSGKPMNHPQRGWIERLLQRLNYKFKTLKIPNEIFYIIRKN